MKEYELHINGYWYARVDATHVIKFDEKDLLDSGLEPEQYAKQLFDHAVFPKVTWHDFDQNIVHEQQQILGDVDIDPIWGLTSNGDRDNSSSE